jgi:CHAD domain-containing protein
MPTRPSTSSIEEFLDKYVLLGRLAEKSLGNFLTDPNERNVHDLRSTLRRLNAAFRVLPKETRVSDGSIDKYEARSKQILRLTSPIRDIDIIQEKLKQLGSGIDSKAISKTLKSKRRKDLGKSKKEARKLLKKKQAVLKSEDLPSFEARGKRVVSDLENKIREYLSGALADESNVDEFHSLRKTIKKLRYTLELFPTTQKRKQKLKSLAGWQDFLGDMLESDVFERYLKTLRRTEWTEEVLQEEKIKRHKKYSELLNVCKESHGKLPVLSTREVLKGYGDEAR